jgi:hypothetical protein
LAFWGGILRRKELPSAEEFSRESTRMNTKSAEKMTPVFAPFLAIQIHLAFSHFLAIGISRSARDFGKN